MFRNLTLLLAILSFQFAGCASTEATDTKAQQFESLCDDIVTLADDALFMRIQYSGEFYERLLGIAMSLKYLENEVTSAGPLREGLISFSNAYEKQFSSNSAPTGLGLIPLAYLLDEHCGISYFEE